MPTSFSPARSPVDRLAGCVAASRVRANTQESSGSSRVVRTRENVRAVSEMIQKTRLIRCDSDERRRAEPQRNIPMSFFEALLKGVSTGFGPQTVEKCFEKTHRAFRSAFQNFRSGAIHFLEFYAPQTKIFENRKQISKSSTHP